MLFSRILGLRKTRITPSKLFITSTSYSSFDSGEFALSDTVIKKISKILTKIDILGWGGGLTQIHNLHQLTQLVYIILILYPTMNIHRMKVTRPLTILYRGISSFMSHLPDKKVAHKAFNTVPEYEKNTLSFIHII